MISIRSFFFLISLFHIQFLFLLILFFFHLKEVENKLNNKELEEEKKLTRHTPVNLRE